MGRHAFHIEEKQLRQLWTELKTSQRIATKLNCHRNTIKKYSKLYGISNQTGPKQGATKKHSQFGSFVRGHNGPLPTSLKELTKLSGCSTGSIKVYLGRLRKEARDLINQKPWLHSGEPTIWLDIGGHKVPDLAFNIVRAQISKFAHIQFKVRLKSQDVKVFTMSSQEFQNLYK